MSTSVDKVKVISQANNAGQSCSDTPLRLILSECTVNVMKKKIVVTPQNFQLFCQLVAGCWDVSQLKHQHSSCLSWETFLAIRGVIFPCIYVNSTLLLSSLSVTCSSIPIFSLFSSSLLLGKHLIHVSYWKESNNLLVIGLPAER